MGIFLVYTIKSAFLLSLFYLFNKVLLEKETFHRLNRVLWILIIPLSYLLAFIGFKKEMVDSTSLGENHLVQIVDPVLIPFDSPGTLSVLAATVILILIFGSLIMTVIWATNLIRLKLGLTQTSSFYASLLDECKNIAGVHKKVNLYVATGPVVPYSWMNNIIISEADINKNGREILLHELSHIRFGHSWDLLLADFLIIVQWFNPASWSLKRSLLQVHEYQADHEVIRSGINPMQYQLLLIEKAVGKSLYTMANSFNHSKLKRRITMMLKEKSNKWAYAKCLYALPLAFFATSIFALPPVDSAINGISGVKFTSLQGKEKTIIEKQIEPIDKPPLYIVDGKEVASLEGINPGSIEMFNVLKNEEAIVKYGKKGENGVVEVTLKKGEYEIANEEAKIEVRVIGYGEANNNGSNNPNFITVRRTGSTTEAQNGEEIGFGTSGQDKPLFIVDGVEVGTISDIPSEKIESVSVLKDVTSIELYGEKGRNGVVVVTTKK